ncbi:MAG: outer membrane protein assembly factor, partial [Planctomycetaceae bacterium]
MPAPIKRVLHAGSYRTGLMLLAIVAITHTAPARALGQAEVRVVVIDVEGNTSIPDAAILQHVRSSVARATNAQQIREDTRQLYSTRWFSSVEHEIRQTEGGPVLVFFVQERPIVRKVEYIGNRKIKRNLLESWTGLRVGSPMDPSANKEAARQIKRRYEEKGFRHAEVTLEQGGQVGDQAVVFRINEGPKVYVYKRVFSGNEFVSAARLKTKLSTKAAVLGLPVMSLGLFNPDTIPNDIEALKQYYHALGYFDAKIQATPKSSADKAWVTVFFTVNEGVRYKVGAIEYAGNGAIPENQLSKGRELKEGDFFNARFMNKDVGNMLTQYDERGHYFAQVQPAPRFREEPGVVDLVYEIDEDRVRILRNINVNLVSEHSNTKETVILDRSPMAPGDIVSRIRQRRFEGRLRSSGIFEQGPTGVRMEVVPVEGARALAARRQNSSVMRGQNAERRSTHRRASKPGFGHTIGSNPWSNKTSKPAVANPFYKPKYFAEPAKTKTIFRGQSPEPAFRSQFPAPTIRGQGPELSEFRGQNFDTANPLYDNIPQGDPFGRQRTDAGFVDINVFAN